MPISIVVRRFFRDLSILLERKNPNGRAEKYIKDKLAKLQGIIVAFGERKQYIKAYVKKTELKQMKNEQLKNMYA